MGLAYRHVQRTDLPAIGALYAAMVDELSLTYPHHDDPAGEIIQWLAQDDPSSWIAEVAVLDALPDGFGRPSGGTPVGIFFGRLEQRTCGHPRLIGAAEWMFVQKEHRSPTIAPTLIKRAIQRAKAAGCEGIEATFPPGTSQERRLRRMGFEAPFIGRAVLKPECYARLAQGD